MSDLRKTYVVGQVTEVLFTDGTTAIIQNITIDCPGCGRGTVTIAGHHIRAVHELLGRTIAALPDKCGPPTELQVLVDPEQGKKASEN